MSSPRTRAFEPLYSLLRGFVVLAGATPIARVRAQAGERLAPAMRLAWLTQLPALPRTASGKLDRGRIARGDA